MAIRTILNTSRRTLSSLISPPTSTTKLFPSKFQPQPQKQLKSSDPNDINEICRVLSDYRNPHHDLESALNCFSPKVSTDLVQQVIKRCKHLSTSAHRFFIWARKSPQFDQMGDAHFILVDVLGNGKQFPLIWDFLTELRDTQCGLIAPKIFWIVFRAYCRADLPNDAIRAFKKMEEFGIEPKVEDLHQLFYFMCKRKFVRCAQEFFNGDVVKFGFELNVKIYSLLMKGWGDVGNCSEACNVFDEMIKQGVTVDLVAFNTLLECLCRGGRSDEAYKLFREMGKAPGLKDLRPDVCTYAVFVRTACRVGDVHSCMRVLDRMRRYNFNPNVFTYSGVIKLFCKKGMLDEAYQLLGEMIKREVRPDVWIYNAMLAFHCDRSEVNMSLRLIRRMGKDGCIADRHTYNMVLKMLIRVGRFDRAFEIWDSMAKKGFYASVSTYSVMIHGLCQKKGKILDACRYFEMMIDDGIPPYPCTCELLRVSLLRLGLRDKPKILTNKMLRSTSRSIQELSNIMNGDKAHEQSESEEQTSMPRGHRGHKPKFVGRLKPKKRRNS